MLGDDQDELDDALQRWSRDLESDHGQVLEFDVRPGDASGLYIATATVPAVNVTAVRHAPKGT